MGCLTHRILKGKKRAAKKKKSPKPARVHAAIKKRNIFTKPKPKGHGLKLTGVLGNLALFNKRGGQTVGIEEGKSGQGIKVISINNYEVTIEYQNKQETLKLHKDQGSGKSAVPAPEEKAESPESGKTAEQKLMRVKEASTNNENKVQDLEKSIQKAIKKRRAGRRPLKVSQTATTREHD